MDFSNLFSQALGARVDQAMQPFQDPTEYLTNRAYADVGIPRADANVTPKTTTITHNEDGTKDVTHKFNVAGPVAPGQGLGPDFAQYEAQPQPQPQARSMAPAPAPVPASMSGMPAQPGAGMFPPGAQPIPAQPPAPQMQPTAAIQQIESGGNPNAVGAAGERGSMQVMPTTGTNPGFGVKPAANNTPAEIDRVGRDYYTAMQSRYNDPVLAAAAYNAGPGTMDRAIARAAQEGGHPMSYMPQSTQKYALQFAQLTGHQPGAANEAGQEPWTIQSANFRMPGHETAAQHDELNAAQGDEKKLAALATNDNVAKPVQAAAREELSNHYDQMKKTDQATKIVENGAQGDATDAGKIASAMNPKARPTEEGSYIKAILFARLGLTSLAQQEMEKISPTTSYQSLMDADGNHYSAKIAKSGEILSAKDAEGKPVDNTVLANLQANATGLKGATTGQTMGFDKTGNTISHTILPNGQGVQWKNETTGKILKGAPEGYHLGKDQKEMLGDTSYKQSLAADEAENRKQKAAGLPPMYSAQEMEARAQGKRNSILGLGAAGEIVSGTAGAPNPVTAETTPTAGGLGPDLERQAQAIARGDVQMPTGMGANNRRNQAIQNRVYELNPNFDPTVFTTRKKTEESFSTGKQGDVVRSMNTAIDHLDTMHKAAEALKNGQVPLFNRFANEFATATGQTAPGNFDAVKTIVGSEVAKAIAGGATALGDREEIRREIDNSRTPQQLAGVIAKYQDLLGGQMHGLETQYKSGGGNRWEEKLNPRTQEVLSKKSISR